MQVLANPFFVLNSIKYITKMRYLIFKLITVPFVLDMNSFINTECNTKSGKDHISLSSLESLIYHILVVLLFVCLELSTFCSLPAFVITYQMFSPRYEDKSEAYLLKLFCIFKYCSDNSLL